MARSLQQLGRSLGTSFRRNVWEDVASLTPGQIAARVALLGGLVTMAVSLDTYHHLVPVLTDAAYQSAAEAFPGFKDPCFVQEQMKCTQIGHFGAMGRVAIPTVIGFGAAYWGLTKLLFDERA